MEPIKTPIKIRSGRKLADSKEIFPKLAIGQKVIYSVDEDREDIRTIKGIEPCGHQSDNLLGIDNYNCDICPGRIRFDGQRMGKCCGVRSRYTSILEIMVTEHLPKELFEL